MAESCPRVAFARCSCRCCCRRCRSRSASGTAFRRPERSVIAGAITAQPRTFERFETAGNVWGEFTNRFDPAQVRLDGEFVAPDGGTIVMPGFYTREFTRALVGGYEHLTPRGQAQWRVRMTPTQPGTWRMALGRDDAGRQRRDRLADLRGRVRPHRIATASCAAARATPRYLRFDDGTPYVAIGENVCWYDGRGTFAYDDWFAKLAAQGVNYVRLWMPSWAFGLEWIARDAGRLGREQLARRLHASASIAPGSSTTSSSSPAPRHRR